MSEELDLCSWGLRPTVISRSLQTLIWFVVKRRSIKNEQSPEDWQELMIQMILRFCLKLWPNIPLTFTAGFNSSPHPNVTICCHDQQHDHVIHVQTSSFIVHHPESWTDSSSSRTRLLSRDMSGVGVLLFTHKTLHDQVIHLCSTLTTLNHFWLNAWFHSAQEPLKDSVTVNLWMFTASQPETSRLTRLQTDRGDD